MVTAVGKNVSKKRILCWWEHELVQTTLENNFILSVKTEGTQMF